MNGFYYQRSPHSESTYEKKYLYTCRPIRYVCGFNAGSPAMRVLWMLQNVSTEHIFITYTLILMRPFTFGMESLIRSMQLTLNIVKVWHILNKR
jgi:hypothetical protein